MRLTGHIGQPLPKNIIDQFYEFFHYCIKAREKLNIDDNNYSLIVNMDETAVYLEMPEKKTIELKGTKNVEINTFGHDKERISVLLAIAGNDNKLPALLIYKGKKGKYWKINYKK